MVANATREVSLPERVRLDGNCGAKKSEITMFWKDKTSGEDNLLNLVMTRRNTHLVYLSGAFLRLYTGGEKEEFYSAMSALEYTTLLWPLRYQMACKDTLSYVMSPAEVGLQLNIALGTHHSAYYTWHSPVGAGHPAPWHSSHERSPAARLTALSTEQSPKLP